MDHPRHGFARRYAHAIWWARWLIVAVWALGAAAATIYLPKAHTSSSALGLVPDNSPIVRAEQQALDRFGVPLLSNTQVVVYNRSGLSAGTQAAVVVHALQIDQQIPHLARPFSKFRILAALPVLNTGAVVPGTRHPGTTAVTYLYFSPKSALADRRDLAQKYAHELKPPPGTQVAVTGAAPARAVGAHVLLSHINRVEAATLAFVVIVLGLAFRSVVAPVVLIGSAFLSYLVGIRLLGVLAERTHVALPTALEPLVIALVLGILTDYFVFFLSGARDRLREGEPMRDAFTVSVRRNAPIVFVAGLTVAAGTASLYAARLELFRAFGPGLAISVAVASVAALTFFPATMAILRERIYWPHHPRPTKHAPHHVVRASWIVRLASHRGGAALIALMSVAGLGAAVYPVTHMKLDLSFIDGLPSQSDPQRGARLENEGLPPGMLAPTVLLVQGNAAGAQQLTALRSLGSQLKAQPHVAGVIGPGSPPVGGAARIFFAPQYDEARYFMYFSDPPLQGSGIDDLRHIQSEMPRLLTRAGLRPAHWQFVGDTAVASATARKTSFNLFLVLGVAFAAEYLILAVFLRALVAPLLLLASSGLVVAAALGLTTAFFQDFLSTGGITFYVPFATGVLLISLGSDYNVFGTGRIWEEAEDRPLRRAIRTALPATTRAITTAGMILAGSFALVSLIPLYAFYEVAFTMFVGLLLDTFVVRSLLTPSLLTLAGPASGWPGHRILGRRREASEDPPVDNVPQLSTNA